MTAAKLNMDLDPAMGMDTVTSLDMVKGIDTAVVVTAAAATVRDPGKS
jgi:hypothetical protein